MSIHASIYTLGLSIQLLSHQDAEEADVIKTGLQL